jgi:allantoin racemase
MIHKDRYIERTSCRKTEGIRLLVISPTDPVDGDEGPFPLTSAERDMLLPSTLVDEVLCKGAPPSISSSRSVHRVIPLIAEKAKWGESNGYDAVIINCMVDPGLREVQRELKIPVIGAGRAATGLATTLGDRPVRAFPDSVRVNELASRKEQALEEIQKVTMHQIRTRGVDSVVFNCAYLGGAAGHLQERIGVPVMPTTEVALRTAETIVMLGILPARPEVAAGRIPEFRQSLFRARDKLRQLTNTLRQKLRMPDT